MVLQNNIFQISKLYFHLNMNQFSITFKFAYMSPCSTCPQCNPQVEAPPPALKLLLLRLQMITPLWLRFLVGGNTKENWQKLIDAGLATPLYQYNI